MFNNFTMGCSESKQASPNNAPVAPKNADAPVLNAKAMIASGKGYFPTKITTAKNPNVRIEDIVYVFGGAKILQFDTKNLKITESLTDAGVQIPKRTQSEFVRDQNKIATLGGMNADGKMSKTGYLFSPPDFKNAIKLPDFPTPIRYVGLAYFNGVLYAIGGEVEGADPDNVSDKVYSLKLAAGSIGSSWEHFCDLPMRRRNPNLLVSNGVIYVFGGYSGNNLRSTQIDGIDINAKTATAQPFRLPLGVEGARLAWHGDKILLIGGKRIGNEPDKNVIQLNFKKKSVLSCR